ncbi:MAG: DUF998 domain-containing protein [Chloroflexota bacterium]
MTTRRLLACGVIAGPLFVITFLVAGATRANYNPLRHPVSSLELGDSGWTQVANFTVTGLFTLAFAAGTRRALRPLGGSTWGPLLVGACAVGLLGAGIFATDPLSGYPPGTPEQRVYSMHGALHDLFSTFYFVGVPAACLVFARRFARWGRRGWAIYSVTTAVSFAVAFVLAGKAFSQDENLVGVGGLFQRIALIAGEGWLTLIAVHLLGTASDSGLSRRE